MSDIKDYFTSRWGDNGWIVNADFSQLEVVALAHLSKDPQLIADILSGLDMHRVRAAELFSVSQSSVTDKQRKLAKALSFQLQYGSGATNMAETNGIPLALAQRFIRQYYERYKQVKRWQESNINNVKANAFTVAEHTKKGYPVQHSFLTSETGRKYMFKASDAPDFMVDRGEYTSFSPTEIKNYPVQGLATGDIVPLVLGKINRWIINSGHYEGARLCNTVHDSIMLDVRDDLLYTICSGVDKIMSSAHEIYEQHFGIEFVLPIKVDITYGRSWGDQSSTYEG